MHGFGQAGRYTLDEFRATIERKPPADARDELGGPHAPAQLAARAAALTFLQWIAYHHRSRQRGAAETPSHRENLTRV
jgi:hypothetical protein